MVLDPLSNFVVSKALTVGFETYVQPFIKETNQTLERIADIMVENSERERLKLFREALYHFELINENDRHREKAQDLLISACASDPYAAVPKLLHGILLYTRTKSSKENGERHIRQALNLNPMLLADMDNRENLPANASRPLGTEISAEGSNETRSVWALDLSEHKRPSIKNTSKATLIRRLIQQINTFTGMIEYNSQTAIVAATVNTRSLFASWIVSTNLRKGSEYLFSRIDHNKVVWTLWAQNEIPLFAGDTFVLSAEAEGDYVSGRSVGDGRLLFRSSKEYAKFMIGPQCHQDPSSTNSSNSCRMLSRTPLEILEFLSKREDEGEQPVADPGFDHIVSSPDALIEEYVLKMPDSEDSFIITNRFHHWHSDTSGNQPASCWLTANAFIQSSVSSAKT